MKKPSEIRGLAPLALAVSALSSAAPSVFAEEDARPEPTGPIEEVVVVGRQYSAAALLTDERIVDSAVTDLLGSDAISRAGDQTVALALQRIPGLTLVNDQFIYVRGLGERYSSTTVNGARVPSVDLSRSVVPLDLFPSFVVDSLRVQKSFSADRPATFGGGNIDIRTKRVPGGFSAGLQLGSGFNTQNDGEMLTYAGGGDDSFGSDDGTRALSQELLSRVNEFQGDISTQSLLADLRARDNPDATLADARALNRELATLLNRDINLRETDTEPDINARGYLGDNYFLTDDLEVGFLVAGGYSSSWRETTRLNRSFRFPELRTDERLQSTYQVNITSSANFGLRFLDEHEVGFSTLFLRNTDDEAAQRTFFNENRERDSGNGFQNVSYRYEERDVHINQLEGTHRFGDATRDFVEDRLGWLPDGLVNLVPRDLEFSWFYSDSDARTDIPSEVQAFLQGPLNDQFEVVDPQVVFSSEALNYRFTVLEDDVLNHGWQLKAPFYVGNLFLELSGGYNHHQQARDYRQFEFDLGPLAVDDIALLSQPLGVVFSDENITDPANNFAFGRTGANNQSYIAATMTDAYFGRLDATWNETWRLAAGLRWEQYRQVGLDVDPFGFSPALPVVTTDVDRLARSVFVEDDLYPEVSLTYMSNWLAETFQLRGSYSETVVRPDLREITDAAYIDPLTDELVFGNPGVVPATLSNYDLRAEWFWSSGDSVTVSLFYKEIEDPIEFFETTASDTQIAREIVNAESAEVYGVEFEVLKDLGSVADWLSPFFVQANLTLQDSEIVAGAQADAPTSPKRELTNASPWIVNIIAGYDSLNGYHSAQLTYNAFDDRLFVAGRNGAPDGFEETRHSLNATYFFYPVDTVTLQLRAQNLFDDPVSIDRDGVQTFREQLGRTFSLSFQWEF